MSRRLRAGLVGFGFISQNGHTPAYLDRRDAVGDVDVIAVADICEARRRLAQELIPGVRVYPDHASLLAAEAGRIDFVDIATPPSEHPRITHAALDAGLHVLCEKPLATSDADARSMIDHAMRARRVLFPVHNYKHAPVVKAIRNALESNRIGKVQLVTLSTYRTTHAKGVPEWRPDWRRERRYSGGGIAMDHGAHTFYLAFEWLGAYPVAISATASTLGDYDTESSFGCTLRMPSGTVFANLTWNAGFRKVIYTIHGERGGIRVEDDELEVTTILGPNGSSGPQTRSERFVVPSLWKDASHRTWFNSVFEDFQAAIESNNFVGRDALDAYMCVRTITSAYASAQSGSREISTVADAGLRVEGTA
jgi:predicted dehydrogenase